jgi:hypothetical protein
VAAVGVHLLARGVVDVAAELPVHEAVEAEAPVPEGVLQTVVELRVAVADLRVEGGAVGGEPQHRAAPRVLAPVDRDVGGPEVLRQSVRVAVADADRDQEAVVVQLEGVLRVRVDRRQLRRAPHEGLPPHGVQAGAVAAVQDAVGEAGPLEGGDPVARPVEHQVRVPAEAAELQQLRLERRSTERPTIEPTFWFCVLKPVSPGVGIAMMLSRSRASRTRPGR